MTQTSTGHTVPTDEEWSFIRKVADHRHDVHGVTHAQGRMMGWMMICDPPVQTLEQMCVAADVQPEEVEAMLVHFVEAGMYERTEREGRSPLFRMTDDGYPEVVAQTFASWPEFHKVMQFGLRMLEEAEAPLERRSRLAELEALYRNVVTDLAVIMKDWRRTAGSAA